MLKTILFVAFIISSPALAQKMRWQSVDTKTNASFRGLSVVDDSVAWVSGSKGWVGITVNGGTTWSFNQLAGYEQCDFRSIYAFDSRNAVVANAGAPAYILRTADGGSTWQKVYENTDTAAFIDGVDFRNDNEGVMYGDPIAGRMLLLGTIDGGKTWTAYPADRCPKLNTGEASFAASGTCIRYTRSGQIVIATGGKISRLFVSRNGGRKWKIIATPILQGEASTGIFSFLALGKRHWVIAGGDYKQDSLRTANLFYTHNGGKTWPAPVVTTGGYRECLVKTGKKSLLAAGPGGIDLSRDNGKHWQPIPDQKQFHVIRKSRNGKLIIAAGGNGKLSVIK